MRLISGLRDRREAGARQDILPLLAEDEERKILGSSAGPSQHGQSIG